ncbi:single-stranded DNA-binding protein [Phytoactinopolyspora halotolerans]|uniref:Single-stranded DNA-binding protein n=1 Tax=Phytoactinopolyspora halotolerans TaxID=1981512 RepID=A0A6L9SBM4_9ACTN|nr:single-stranded DNA-binding protein [Phytoactinopolyspora halotolerans]NEE02666.1 single-stranded DNA-binding protein [Phytoactinopolyspora halotolerans]
MTAATVTVSGNVATNVKKEEKTETGEPWCHFRIACNERYFDNRSNRWVDGEPSFYTVVCWHPLLARNALASLKKGEPIVVHGRMRVRDWRDERNVQRYSMEITASSIGHDLYRGISAFRRAHRQASIEAESDEVKNAVAVYTAGDDGVDQATGEVPSMAVDPARTSAADVATEERTHDPANVEAGNGGDWSVSFSDSGSAGAGAAPGPADGDDLSEDDDDVDGEKELVGAALEG